MSGGHFAAPFGCRRYDRAMPDRLYFTDSDEANALIAGVAILVSAAGPQPKRALEDHGLQVLEMEGMIEEGLTALFAGKPIPTSLTRRFTSCGSGCKGTGTGCG